ncbi:response regulator [candidate division KSB1 bacterium]|nr:response regulator [candidate division KSB1 bacterium]
MSNQTKDRILIVEDDSEFRRSLKRILQKAGYHVSSASNGSQASEMLNKRVYPLILLDLHMQGKSGLELLHEVKGKTPESKVIMITVDDSADNYSEAMSTGAFAVLQKPLKMKKLLTYASMALNNNLN